MSSESSDFLWRIIRSCATMGGDVAAIRAVGLTIAFFLLFFWAAWWCIKLVFRIFKFIFGLFGSNKKKAQQEFVEDVTDAVEDVEEKQQAVKKTVEEVKQTVEEKLKKPEAPAEEPAAEEPAAEEPVVEEPAAEEPVVEEPAAEEPVAEEPVAEEPAEETEEKKSE